jgi:hypothetical protein
MVKLSKNHQKREIVAVDVKQAKQSTLEDLSFQFNIERTNDTNKPIKAIVINRISDATREDELALRVEFSLLPSPSAFSKVNLDLYFQEILLKSVSFHILQSELLGDNLEYPLALDMRGIAEGNYLLRFEMYEPWDSGEKLNFVAKEIAIQYVPQTRADRLVKIPTVRSVAGADLTVVSSSAKDIFREIEQDQKQEEKSKRDEW